MNAPDPPHFTVNSRFAAFRTIWVHFGTVWLPYETRCKTGRTSAKVRAAKSSRIFFAMNAPNPPHWTLNSCFVAFCTVLVHLRPFGCLTNLRAKRCRVGIFDNERTRSNPLDPKLMFCCVSYYLGAFGTVWLPYETQCKTGRTSEKVGATKSRRNFFATNAPDRPHWTLNSCFVAFRIIWDRLVALQNWCKMGRTNAKVRATKSRRSLSRQMHPIHPIGP